MLHIRSARLKNRQADSTVLQHPTNSGRQGDSGTESEDLCLPVNESISGISCLPPSPSSLFPEKSLGYLLISFWRITKMVQPFTPPPLREQGGRHLIPLMVQAPSQAIGRGRGTGRGSGTNLWRPGRPRRKSTEPKPNCPGYQMQHCGKAPKSTVVKIGIRDIRTSPFLLTGQKRLVFVRNKESHP